MKTTLTRHSDALRKVFQALEPQGDGTLSFLGHRVGTPHPETPVAAVAGAGSQFSAIQHGTAQHGMAQHGMAQHGAAQHGAAHNSAPRPNPLRDLLYAYAYTRPFDPDSPAEAVDTEVDGDWVGRLVAANASQERWDPGWAVQMVLPSGGVLVAKGRRQRVLAPGQFASYQTHGQSVAQGNEVAAYAAAGSLTLQSGFYYIFGEYLTDAAEDLRPLRLYVNVGTETAEPWIRDITTALNRYRIPFRLKVATVPGQLRRRSDGLVIFVHRRYLRVTTELLAEGARYLSPESPLFTLPLFPGLSLAEDPGNGESFGLHRCRLVSDAIWSLYRGQAIAGESWLEAVRAHFEAHGLDWSRPYLNPGSTLATEVADLEPRSEELAA